MPMLQVMRCPVCGKQSEPSDLPTNDWITVSVVGQRQETLDTWACAVTYSQLQKDNADREAAAQATTTTAPAS